MAESIAAQIKILQGMTVCQLREKWLEIFSESTKQRHKMCIIKRLAWQIQADRFGGLSDEATTKIAELRGEFEHTPPSEWLNGGQTSKEVKLTKTIRDPRLPKVGTAIARKYKGREVVVRVLENGFEFEGRIYRSLSAIAREITGSNWNGYVFWGLAKR